MQSSGHGVPPIITSTWDSPSIGVADPTRQPTAEESTISMTYPISSNPTYDNYGPSHHSNLPMLVDARLQHLDISEWTDVPITSDLAARMISYYLESDHPVLGFFDAELFVNSLTTGYGDYCSPFLVSVLMYWICVGIRIPGLSEVMLTDVSMPTDH